MSEFYILLKNVLRNTKKKLWHHKLLTFFTAATLLSYCSVLVSPAFFWPSTFLSYSIPLFVFANVLLLMWLAVRRKLAVVCPAICLVLAIPFALITWRNHPQSTTQSHSISVLSFNAKLFRKAKTYGEFSTDLIEWVARDTSSIKCIQEFSTNSRWRPLDVTAQITEQGYHDYTYKSKIANNDHNRGLGIFTRFEIVRGGIVCEDSTSINGAIFADVLIGTDTFRVYNVHLASMNLDLSSYRSLDHYPSKLVHLVRQLKKGSVKRSLQAEQLLRHTEKCRYPFIICGDFNEMPYSYNYFRLRRHFKNSFEQAGRGFGFSLNSRAFFLRIDNQFFSQGVQASSFTVDYSMRISDHFPTRGMYTLLPGGQ